MLRMTIDLAVAYVSAMYDYRCDDGSLLIDRAGNINWSCRIDGCSPKSPVCWEYRTNCFANDPWSCEVVDKCDTTIDCIQSFGGCQGTFWCVGTEDGIVCYCLED